MKIVHICLNGPFTERWSYQENLISDYHRKFGHEVTVITQTSSYNSEGYIVETTEDDKVTHNGVRLIRLKQNVSKLGSRFVELFLPYKIYNILVQIKPDFIMIHGLIGSLSALDVIKYVKKVNPKCRVVVDTHQDFYNSKNRNSIKGFLLRLVRRKLNKKLIRIAERIYYVAPSCKEHAIDYYSIPEHKLSFLPLGNDFKLINSMKNNFTRQHIREKYSISKDEVVICHGGKMDNNKKTLEVIEAFKELKIVNTKIRLLLFGVVLDEIKDVFFQNIESHTNINFLGLLSTQEYLEIFIASDIALFPGSQSALWQQAITCGLPLLIQKHRWHDYLDLGGNVRFLDSDNPNDIKRTMFELIESKKYIQMKKIAIGKSENIFSYENISKKLIEERG